MQMNKAILRNSKIVVFDKKNCSYPGEFFSQPAGLETDFFSCRPYICISRVVDNVVPVNHLFTHLLRCQPPNMYNQWLLILCIDTSKLQFYK